MNAITLGAVPANVPRDRIIHFDPLHEPGLEIDVHTTTAAGRDSSPALAYTTANGGHWVAFGRKVIERVLSDTDFFSSKRLTLQPMPNEGAHKMIPLQLDPPEHTPYRHVLLKHVGPKEVRGLEPFVREWAERLIDPLVGQTECDFVTTVAEPMPVSVFMELMGLPLDRFHEFRTLVTGVVSPGEEVAPELRGQRTQQIISVLSELIEARRREPRDDLISKLLAEEIDGRPINQQEMANMCFLLFTAGLDTVTNAMGYGMRHLAANRELQDQIRADPKRIPGMVEDLLSQFAFVNTIRTATRDVELDGVMILEGESVICSLWGGSNDDRGDSVARHLAFGFGPHMCLGMHLARLEMRVMYEVWFEKIKGFRRGEEKPGSTHGGMVMGIVSVPLVLEPAAPA